MKNPSAFGEVDPFDDPDASMRQAQCPDCSQQVTQRYQRFNVMHEKRAWRMIPHNGPCGHPCIPAGSTYDGTFHVGLNCAYCKRAGGDNG